MQMTQLEFELARAGLFVIGVWVISTAIGLWVMYWLIKSAIRDGINESRLVDSWAKTVAKERKPDLGNLPDMRAD